MNAVMVSLDTSGESFEGKKGRERTRLTAKEIEPIRYIFSEWDGEAGMGSSAAQLERLAAMPTLLAKGAVEEARGAALIERAIDKAWLRAWQRDPQVMVAHGSKPAFRDTYSATERWTDGMVFGSHPTDNSVQRHRCRAAMALLTRHRRAAPVILHALYGDKPPGLLSERPWPKDVNAEYVRVLRFVDEAPTVPEFEKALRVEPRRHGETEAQWRARRAATEPARWALVNDLGRKCEALIERATEDYRGAWEAAA